MRLLFTLVLTYLLSNAQAQQPVVEVIVEDSVMITADEIIYTILVSQDYTVDTLNMEVEPTGVKSSASQPSITPLPIDVIRQIVREMRLDTLADPTYAVDNSPYNSNRNALHVRFTSLEGVQKFVGRIRAINNVSGSISSVKSANEPPAQNKLSQRLMNKARSQATMLAQASGKQLGTVLSVKEQSIEGGGWTMYPPLSALTPGWHTTISGNSSTYVLLQKRLLVQFSWR